MSKLSVLNKSDKSAYIQVLDENDLVLYSGEIKSGDMFEKSFENDIKKLTFSDADAKESRFTKFFSGLGYVFAAAVMLFFGEWSDFRKNVSLPFEIDFDEIPNSINLQLHNQKNGDIKAFELSSDDTFRCETADKDILLRKQFIQAQIILALQFLIGFSPIAVAFVFSIVTAKRGLAAFLGLILMAILCLFIRFFDKNLKSYKNLKSCNNK